MTATKIAAGERMPEFHLLDDEGNAVTPASLEGRWAVLYFYPKDDTPGCTTQACDLRDNWSEFESRDDLLIYGVSPDSAASHRSFREKHALPFNLLVDTDHELASALGIWGEKKNYGKTYEGITRSTVILAPDGTVHAVRRNVKPADHVDWLRRQLGE
jgi:thioredoxin-dependent peroxiredoxin